MAMGQEETHTTRGRLSLQTPWKNPRQILLWFPSPEVTGEPSVVPQCSHQIPCRIISAKPRSPEHISQALPQLFQIEFRAAHDSSPCHFLGFALFSPEWGTFNRVTRCMTQKFTPSMEAKTLCLLWKPKRIKFQETLLE